MFSIYTLSGYDATSHPYGKRKITVLNNLFARDHLGLVNVLGEGSIKHANIQEAAKPFCIVLYDKLRQAAMEFARFTFLAKKNTFKSMALPQTTTYLFQQVLRAHL